MFGWRTVSLFSLALLPVLGCSTTSDFAEELHGDWYTEGSCDVVKISAEETTGKVWYLRGATDGGRAAVDGSPLDTIETAAAKTQKAPTKVGKKTGKSAKKSGPPSSGAKKAAPKGPDKAANKEATAKPSKEEMVQLKIDENNARIATLKAEEPRWSHQNFSLKLDSAQKEIKAVGDKRIVQFDGIFVNGEGCKGTATLSGERLVFAFAQNVELDSAGKPDQSLCSSSFNLFSKKPESCTLPIELGKAEITKVKSLLAENKTALRKLRSTPGSKATADSYPHACNDLDPKLHTKIVGAKGQCAPKRLLALTRAGWMVEDFTNTPSRFHDSNEMSHLLGPKKEIGEKTNLSSDKRKKNASRIKNKVYYDKSGPKSCKAKYNEKSGSLTVNCDMPMRNIYTSGSAGFNKTQECENTTYTPGICKDRCESHSDCDGWFCGCGSSRCTIFGVCTACPTEYGKDCKDPEFTVTGIKNWKMTKKISGKQKAAAKALAKSTYSSDPIFLFRMESAYRKVFQEEKYGEMEVEKDSGYIIKSKPLFMAFQTPKGTLVMHTAAFTGYHKADGKTYKISCNEKAQCEIELRKKKKK